MNNLFIWKSGASTDCGGAGGGHSPCRYCGTERIYINGEESYGDNTDQKIHCTLCGFRATRLIKYYNDYSPSKTSYWQSSLKAFNVDDSNYEAALSAFTQFLQQFPAANFSKFCQSLMDVMSSHGLMTLASYTTLNQQSQVILLNDGKQDFLVIVDLYSEKHTCNIALVRKLFGVCVDFDKQTASLVFERKGREESDRARFYSKSDHELTLPEISELMVHLKLYNCAQFQPLYLLDVKTRQETIEINRAEILAKASI